MVKLHWTEWLLFILVGLWVCLSPGPVEAANEAHKQPAKIRKVEPVRMSPAEIQELFRRMESRPQSGKKKRVFLV
jgi:hypothetical protein